MYIQNPHVKRLQDIQLALQEAGLYNFFESGKSILYKGSDSVFFKIKITDKGVQVLLKPPQVGNEVQVIVTILVIFLLFVLAIFTNVHIGWGFLVAFFIGQILAYFFYSIKLSSLKASILAALELYKIR